MSMDPIELKEFIFCIKEINKLLGKTEKKVLPCEIENFKKLKKKFSIKNRHKKRNKNYFINDKCQKTWNRY